MTNEHLTEEELNKELNECDCEIEIEPPKHTSEFIKQIHLDLLYDEEMQCNC